MATTDEILSIVTAALFAALFVQFCIRFARSKWGIYAFIIFFCSIRIVAYILRAYLAVMNEGLAKGKTIEHDYPNYVSILITQMVMVSIGAIFILLLMARLYHSILPKMRHHAGHERGRFESTLVDRTRLFMLPVIACIIVGAVFASPDYSADQQNIGLICRKVGVIGLFLYALVFLAAAGIYRRRYPEAKRSFMICEVVTGLFVVSLIYKIVATFSAAALNNLTVYYIFSPLVELIALCFLCVDLQLHFLGRPEDKV
ncbi:hypothetical protein MVEG_07134 [Podila verticillata NRRL 6337]|nr:hypothetical protein MVEG_07134 [Podila verticillata NRRL 6337]